MIDITLAKLKYRNPNHKILKRQGVDPPEGTRVVAMRSKGKYAGNSGTKSKKVTVRPRRRAYGPW